MDKGGRGRDSSLDAYEALDTVGSGSYGRVVRVRRKSDGRLLVWKEVDYGHMSDKEKQLIVSEVNILREFRHPHIVRYYDRVIARESRRLYIVMEYCEGGDLAQLIKARRKAASPLEEPPIWRVLLQLSLALRECHGRKPGKVLHRDIKPANVLLSGGPALHVKLGDFGLARILSENSRFAYTNVGTPYYMAPEQVDELPYDDKCDIWSLGCVIYELCMLHPPFEASNQLSLANKIKEATPEPCRPYTAELCAVIERLLTKDRVVRPSIEELLEFPAISLRLKELKVAEALASLKRREEELKKRSDELQIRELALAERERAVAEQERRGSAGGCRCGIAAPGRLSPPCPVDSPGPTFNSTPWTAAAGQGAVQSKDRPWAASPKWAASPGHPEAGQATPAARLDSGPEDSPPDVSPGYAADDRVSPRAGLEPADPPERAPGAGAAQRPPLQRKPPTVRPTIPAAPLPSRHRSHTGSGKAGNLGSEATAEDQTSLYRAFRVAR
eukprot:EG_transcript_7706